MRFYSLFLFKKHEESKKNPYENTNKHRLDTINKNTQKKRKLIK